MTSSAIDQSQIRYARLAGFMYLFVDAAYALGFILTARFQVPGNFAETAHRIMASEQLYRTGLSSELIGALCTVLLAMGLYVAVKPINSDLALLAFVFRLVEANLFAVQVMFSFDSMKLYIAAGHGNAVDATQLSVLVNSGSVSSSAGFNIAAIFFSVGSILFFYLFRKTNYIPRILSASGLLGSVLVPIVSFGYLISPPYARVLQLGWIPIGLAEILVGFWLLFKGINLQPRDSRNRAGIHS